MRHVYLLPNAIKAAIDAQEVFLIKKYLFIKLLDFFDFISRRAANPHHACPLNRSILTQICARSLGR